jgi:DNA-binding ferritin-like protein
VSEERLKRIERVLEKLAARQAALLDRLERLEDEETATPLREVESPRDRVIAFLDEFRAGEALGESSLGAWIHVCRDSTLRGGLRVVQAREASHARLLAERIKELGGALHFEIPDATYEQVMTRSASSETCDAEKVAAFVARFPDPERAVAPIHAVADTLDDDPETQSLLRTIADDERATLAYFYAQRERMERPVARDERLDPPD